jgi:hypothetical protein
MKNIVEWVLSCLDLVIGRRNALRNTSEDSYKNLIYSHFAQPVFKIPLNITRDFFGFDFSCGYNPYIRTLLDYIENQDKIISNEKSKAPLYEYYSKFCPHQDKDVFLKLDKLGKGLFEYQLPWDYSAKSNKNAQLNYCGPVPMNRIKKEIVRIISVFESIKNKGYCPKKSSDLFNSNHIQGYFLKRGDDYRFIVLHGKHRIASLSVLGYCEIPVTFCINKPRIVFAEDVKNFPSVMNGYYSIEEASEIFNFFFDFDGLKIANKFNIQINNND